MEQGVEIRGEKKGGTVGGGIGGTTRPNGRGKWLDRNSHPPIHETQSKIGAFRAGEGGGSVGPLRLNYGRRGYFK